MPEKYRVWDVINYLDSPRDAYLYLEAAAEDDDGEGDEIRFAWEDVKRACKAGKVVINLEMTSEELHKTLEKYGIYESAIPKIVSALEMTAPISD